MSSALSPEQQRQLAEQLEAHRHGYYETEIKLGGGDILLPLRVHPHVMRPEQMVSSHLAQYLFRNQHLVSGRTVIDMGCGSGIQGIVAAGAGAEHVWLSDRYDAPVANTRDNVQTHALANVATVIQGDLFERIREQADVIIFNHPFFPASPIPNIPVSAAMVDEGQLIHRFFEQARGTIGAGLIIMPYFHLAGVINDPGLQAQKHGLIPELVNQTVLESGLQRGLVSIYHIRMSR